MTTDWRMTALPGELHDHEDIEPLTPTWRPRQVNLVPLCDAKGRTIEMVEDYPVNAEPDPDPRWANHNPDSEACCCPDCWPF